MDRASEFTPSVLFLCGHNGFKSQTLDVASPSFMQILIFNESPATISGAYLQLVAVFRGFMLVGLDRFFTIFYIKLGTFACAPGDGSVEGPV